MARSPRQYKAQMGYWLKPTVELVVQFELEEKATRTYAKCQLKRGEFVGDGKDEIAALVTVRRIDSTQPDDYIKDAKFDSVDWLLGEIFTNLIEATEDAQFTTPGKKRFKIKAKDVLMFKKDSVLAVSVRVKAKVTLPKQEDPLDLETSVKLCPGYVDVRFWVAPGKARHHSEAGAVTLCRSERIRAGQRLVGLNLEIRVETLGGGGAQLVPTRGETRTSNDQGQCLWMLKYEGLNWKNLGSAHFKVKCRVGQSQECASFSTHVGQNVLEFLMAFQAAVPSLDLTNPMWPDDSSVVDVYAGCCLGLATNTISMLGSDRYVCASITQRIIQWAVNRRFGVGGESVQNALKMNGIDVGIFEFHPIHVSFGFHLAGMDPWDKGTQCIDPWWKQKVDNAVVISLDEQLVRLAGVLTWGVVHAIVLAYLGRPLFRPLLAHFSKPSAFATAVKEMLAKKWAAGAVRGVFYGGPTAIAGYMWQRRLGTGFSEGGKDAIFFSQDGSSYTHHSIEWIERLASELGSSPAAADVEPW